MSGRARGEGERGRGEGASARAGEEPGTPRECAPHIAVYSYMLCIGAARAGHVPTGCRAGCNRYR